MSNYLMSNNERGSKKEYDLEERTAKFGEAVIDFAKKIPRNPVTIPIISQLIRAGTSVGANYCEADDASSKKDFNHKISTCKKEARESKFWLRMVAKVCPKLKDEAKELWKEANELHLIFASILRSSKSKKN